MKFMGNIASLLCGIIFALSCVFSPFSVYAAWDVPYAEFFENRDSGTDVDGWRGFSVNGATATFQSDSYIQGAQGLGVVSGEVALTIIDAELTLSNVWCHLYSKPILHSSTPSASLAATNVVAFCVKDDGTLLAYSTNAWTDVGTVPTDEWIGFAMHLDYANSNWDLYVDTNNSYYSTSRFFSKMNTVPLGFNVLAVNKTQFRQFVATNTMAEPLYLDAIAVSVALTNCNATLAKLQVADRMANQAQMIGIPPYSYSDSSLAAGSQLALDLSQGLDGLNNNAELADQLKIHDSNGWNIYYLDTSTNWNDSIAITSANVIDLDLITGMWLDRKGVKDILAFYPFVSAPSAASYSQTIYGSDSTKLGWNMLVWPSVYNKRYLNPAANLGLQNTIGSQMRIYENGRYRKLWWETSTSSWFESRNPVSYEIKPGQVFWYYRAQTGDVTWTIPSD